MHPQPITTAQNDSWIRKPRNPSLLFFKRQNISVLDRGYGKLYTLVTWVLEIFLDSKNYGVWPLRQLCLKDFRIL